MPSNLNTDPSLLSAPKNQEIHSVGLEAYGLNLDAVKDLSNSIIESGLASDTAVKKLKLVPSLVELVPMANDVIESGSIRQDTIRKNIDELKTISPKLRTTERVARRTGKLGKDVLDRYIVKKSEASVLEHEHIIQEVREQIERLAEYDNPQSQLVSEINTITSDINDASYSEMKARISGESIRKYDGPGGIKGLFIKAVTKVKQFFGKIFGSKVKKYEVNAEDVGHGIKSTLDRYNNNPEYTREKLPMLSSFLPVTTKYVPDLINKFNSLKPIHFGLLAPEILRFLYSGSEDEYIEPGMISSVQRNPHPLRFALKYVKPLYKIQKASIEVLPNLIRSIPNTNEGLLLLSGRIDAFINGQHLKASTVETNTEENKISTKVRSKVKSYVSQFKSRRQKQTI